MDAKLRLSDALGKVEVRRRVVNGVAAENEQKVYLTGIEVLGQLCNRLNLILGPRIDRVRINDGLPDITESGIHRVRQRVNNRRLVVTGDYDAASSMLF